MQDAIGRLTFPSMGDFYAADERRLTSEECDYGVHWRLHGWAGRWRVSYVQATGEIYAVNHNRGDGLVFVLGVVAPDPVAEGDRRSLYYATLERILDGWPERCGQPDGLRWVKDTLDAAGVQAA